jgi:hypothetical protein
VQRDIERHDAPHAAGGYGTGRVEPIPDRHLTTPREHCMTGSYRPTLERVRAVLRHWEGCLDDARLASAARILLAEIDAALKTETSLGASDSQLIQRHIEEYLALLCGGPGQQAS